MSQCGNCSICSCGDQPPDDLEYQIDGVFVKVMHIKNKGTLVPQHSHVYDHGSMLSKGSVRIWRDGKLDEKEYHAPEMIFVKSGVKHAFMSTEDDTTILCIHNTSRTGNVEISSFNQTKVK